MKKSYSNFLKIMFFIVFISSLAALSTPIIFSYWSFKKEPLTVKVAIIVMVIMCISILLEALLSLVREHFSKEFNRNNFLMMLRNYFKLRYDYVVEEGSHNLMERMIIYVNSIYNYMTGDYINVLSTALITVSILMISLIYDVKIFLIFIVVIPINYFGYKLLNKKLSEESKILQSVCANNWQAILSVMNQVDYIKQLGNHDNLVDKINPLLKEIYSTMSKVNIVAQSSSIILRGINTLAQTLIMLFVVLSYANNEGSAVTVIIMTILVPMYFTNLKNISTLSLNKRELKASEDFFEKWKNEYEQSGKEISGEINSIKIDIDELSINNNVLSKNIKETFNKGDVVWIRGKSGKGKSTLLKLIPKFRTVDSIYINGKNIKEYDTYELRNKICYLSQEVPIINASLRDNIFLNLKYDKNIEKKILEEPILESILRNKSLDDIIDPKGSVLSGGEKQKIAVIRAIYDSNEVLILDEITSNIDRESALDIYDRLMELKKDKIIFIVSHDTLPERVSNKIVDLD